MCRYAQPFTNEGPMGPFSQHGNSLTSLCEPNKNIDFKLSGASLDPLHLLTNEGLTRVTGSLAHAFLGSLAHAFLSRWRTRFALHSQCNMYTRLYVAQQPRIKSRVNSIESTEIKEKGKGEC